MRVTPVAWTNVEFCLPDSIQGTRFDDRVQEDLRRGYLLDTPSDSDLLAEMAGRGCYEAWELKNAATANNKGYLANIIDHEHFSVLEHASVTFYVEGVSRSLLAELTRHRHLSFSVRSQRYVDESEAELVVPPIIEELGGNPQALDDFRFVVLEAYTGIVQQLTEKGVPRKQAREAARSVLPNATETKFFVTGNHRAWREVLAKRNSPHADREIQQLAKELLCHLKDIAPNTYQDME